MLRRCIPLNRTLSAAALTTDSILQRTVMQEGMTVTI